MKRRPAILVGAATMALAFTNPLSSQELARLPRVGILNPNTPAIGGKYVEAFRDELGRLGYSEGRNVSVEVRYADGQPGRLRALASELADLQVKVIVAPSEPALLAAKEAGRGVPIVAVSCDPLQKLLGSLARPGGGATGFSCVSSDLAGKRLSLLKDLVPGLRRVALLYTAQVAYEPDLMNVEQSAKAIGLSITRFEVSAPTEFDLTFAEMKSAGSEAIYISLSGFANLHRRKFAELALRHRLPAIFGFREFVEDGGLVSYGASNSDGYRRAAHFVDKILNGTPPSALPAEEPTRFELVINRTTAAALGVAIPPILLVQADEVVD